MLALMNSGRTFHRAKGDYFMGWKNVRLPEVGQGITIFYSLRITLDNWIFVLFLYL